MEEERFREIAAQQAGRGDVLLIEPAMRPESAARIGLIPEELSDRVTVLGNAAGSGALRYATEEGAAESALGIIRRTRYIELSAHAGFTDAYVERMLFPERE